VLFPFVSHCLRSGLMCFILQNEFSHEYVAPNSDNTATAHPASFTMGTGSVSGGKAVGAYH
jgi:hypothetical protein